MVTHVCDPGIQEAEGGGLEGCFEFRASLGTLSQTEQNKNVVNSFSSYTKFVLSFY